MVSGPSVSASGRGVAAGDSVGVSIMQHSRNRGVGVIGGLYCRTMYQLTVEREFCAAHAIWINGELEPMHGHNWRVRCIVQGESLDSNGLVVDFHRLERDLDGIIEPFHNHSFNETPPFDELNPTAEHVAQFIGESIAECLPESVSLHSLSVTEAPGCVATYLP